MILSTGNVAPCPKPSPTTSQTMSSQFETSNPPPTPAPTITQTSQLETSNPPPTPAPTITQTSQLETSNPPPTPAPTTTQTSQVGASNPPPSPAPTTTQQNATQSDNPTPSPTDIEPTNPCDFITCDLNAFCVPGSFGDFTCICIDPFEGNGFTCTTSENGIILLYRKAQSEV